MSLRFKIWFEHVNELWAYGLMGYGLIGLFGLICQNQKTTE